MLFCRTCLYQLNNPRAKVTFTCERRLAFVSKEGEYRTKKRQWWLRLKEEQPLFAQDLLAALERTQADVDAFLGLKPEDTCASLGHKAQKASKASAAKAAKGARLKARAKAKSKANRGS